MNWKALVGFILAFFGVVSIVYYVMQINATHDIYANLAFFLFDIILIAIGGFILSKK